ncbi:MAG: SMP-30/gluconolactonase/LRE family protein [Blastocatellia bacterium]
MTTLKTITKALTLCALIALLAVWAVGQADANAANPQAGSRNPSRPFGDVQALAQAPAPPGFPEGIGAQFGLVYVAGPATLGTAGNGTPSKTLVFNGFNGDLLLARDVIGEDLTQEHANSCLAFDGFGRVYVLNLQLGVLRYDPLLRTQQSYSGPFPNLPPCNQAAPGTPCSPTVIDLPPLPNDLAFDQAGNLFVTDSLQATIWRIPAGGGAPQIWFQDNRLAPGPVAGIGANGIRFNPQGAKLFITVSEDQNGQAFVYTLPRVAQPAAADLQVFHHYTSGDIPDGIAFGKTGLLYVTIATPFNSGISILRPNGTELTRLANPPGSPISPYDSPANIAFDNKGSLLVTNRAFATGGQEPAQFKVLDVFVNDNGAPLARPFVP